MSIESLLQRDRRIVFASVTALTLLAWLYMLHLAGDMKMASAMPNMPNMSAMAYTLHSWTATDFVLIFVMWSVMMVGMMTPSATPMVLIYARVARLAVRDGKPLASTAWFAAGYLLSWTAFSFVATAAQGALERLAWITPTMVAASNEIGGIVLVAAGIYQFTTLKYSCLSRCQSPFAFVQAHGGFRPGTWNALRLGFRHGIYCVGCCWAIMLLLFAVGVMNIFWIAAISIFVLIERTIPVGRWVAGVSGALLVIGGIWLFLE